MFTRQYKNLAAWYRLGIAIAVFIGLVSFPGCFEPVDATDRAIERAAAAVMEVEAWRATPPPPGRMNIEDAIEFAWTHNLAVRAAEIEYAIEEEIRDGARLKMLPSLVAGIDASSRSKYNASSSESIDTGATSLRSSFSRERDVAPVSVSLVWSILDFGLSAVKRNQAAEQAAIAAQNLRRLRQQIAAETAIAYYRLGAAEDIMRVCASLEESIELQLEVIGDALERRAISKNEHGKRAMPLLLGLRTLADLRREREKARINLAKAMGASAPEAISLAETTWLGGAFSVPDDIESLWEAALVNRPEMHKGDSEKRIACLEAKAAVLQLAPNVNLSASLQHDGDRYLVYHNWMEAAMKVSWDLLRLPAKHRAAQTAKQKAALAELRTRVTSASVIMQVSLALMELNEIGSRMRILDRIESNRRDILDSEQERIAQGQAQGAGALAERIRHVSDYANRQWARADFMAAQARLLSALGEDAPWREDYKLTSR